MSDSAQRSQDGSSSQRAGLILFALGAAQVPPRPPLPGFALLALLADVGLSEGAARSAILRMRQGGWLVSHREGRTVCYAPSEHILVGHRRRASTFIDPEVAWSGSFHALLVSVPEQDRAFRDEFRRAAQIAGYRTIHAGLLIAPGDRRDEMGHILHRVPSGATVMPGWLELDPDDARRVARDLWKLDELGDRYRALVGHVDERLAAVGTNGPTGAEAFRALVGATLPIYQSLADDPGLPPELLPAGWPAAQLGVALRDALHTFGPAVASYINDLRHASAYPSQLGATRT